MVSLWRFLGISVGLCLVSTCGLRRAGLDLWPLFHWAVCLLILTLSKSAFKLRTLAFCPITHIYLFRGIYFYIFIVIFISAIVWRLTGSYTLSTFSTLYVTCLGFPGGSDGKESACNARDPGSIPGSGRSPGEGNGYPLQNSYLENSTDRGAINLFLYGSCILGHLLCLNTAFPPSIMQETTHVWYQMKGREPVYFLLLFHPTRSWTPISATSSASATCCQVGPDSLLAQTLIRSKSQESLALGLSCPPMPRSVGPLWIQKGCKEPRSRELLDSVPGYAAFIQSWFSLILSL